MSFITLDIETYYAKDFTLSKMTTEEYIRDSRFEIIGVGLKVDDGETQWFSGSHNEIRAWLLGQADWEESAVLCHNTMFDGAILEWILDIHPAYYYDTLCIARAIHGVEAGGSLASLVERYGLGTKGTEVLNALGKNRRDFSDSDLSSYGSYCRNDVDLTVKLFEVISSKINQLELDLIDMTIQMFTRPQLMVDDFLLAERLEEVQKDKLELLGMLKGKLGVENEEEVRKLLSSNKKFAEVLSAWGVVPPTKISPTTGKETFAFAKNDVAFMELQQHPDPDIQQLCAVRLGTKSTIEEGRLARFIEIGNRNCGRLPIPLRYYGAHTGRWAGLDSVNMQNLPSRDKKKKALKNSIVAPIGYVVLNCDSSQIEARVLAWLAEQEDVVEQFRNGEDVYSVFATKVYGRPISRENPTERHVGKTATLGLGFGTGAEKLRHTLSTQPPCVELKIEECKQIVSVYRSVNYKIPELWGKCDAALDSMLNKKDYGWLDSHHAIWVDKDGIRLPNGLRIRYNNLRLVEGRMVYDSRRGPVNIWGGAMVENIVQALARIIVGQQLVWVQEELDLRAALTVHDAGVWVVPEHKAEEIKVKIMNIMSRTLPWAAGLPVACEAKYAARYGAC